MCGQIDVHADTAVAMSRGATRRRFPPIFLPVHAAEIREKLNMVYRGHVRMRRCDHRLLRQSRPRARLVCGDAVAVLLA